MQVVCKLDLFHSSNTVLYIIKGYKLSISDGVFDIIKRPLLYKEHHLQWRIQEFQNEGGGGSGAVELLGSGDCFDVPSHIPIPCAFIVRVENKIHIVNIAY